MESAVVNARVPVAKRDAAKSILDSLGKTTTDLINSAYDFVISERRLPCASAGIASRSERIASFQSFLAEATCQVDWSEDPQRSDKDLLAEALEEKYGTLA